VIIKARLKTVPVKQWMVGRAFNRRMKKRFDALGIEIPFPHQTVYFGIDKNGAAPPARIRVENSLNVESQPPPHDEGAPPASAEPSTPATPSPARRRQGAVADQERMEKS
jgi:moderate conductance mechanosensitive channel